MESLTLRYEKANKLGKSNFKASVYEKVQKQQEEEKKAFEIAAAERKFNQDINRRIEKEESWF